MLCNKILLMTLTLAGVVQPLQGESLTFSQAWEKVKAGNPELSAKAKAVEAAGALKEQARVLPNPELEVELENFGANEIEVAVTQPIELGGKRKGRTTLAEKKVEAAGLEKEAIMRSLKGETVRCFLAVLAKGMERALVDVSLGLAEKTKERIQVRVRAGAAMQVDLLRVENELDELALEKKVIKKERQAAINELAILWGQAGDIDIDVTGEIKPEPTVPSREECREALGSHPEILLQDKGIEMARAEAEAARSDGRPDLEISGGYVRNNELKENAIVLGAGMALPLFDRNKGNIKAGDLAISIIEKEKQGQLAEKQAELNSIYDALENTREQITSIKNTILPRSQEIHESLSAHYANGGISLLEVIEAQADLQEQEKRVVELTIEQARLLANLQELTGLEINIITE